MSAKAALQAIGPSLWLAEGDMIRFLTFPFPIRMLVARLGDGALWIWSPVRLTEQLRAEINALGPVGHLVRPNKLHHLYLGEWKEAFPAAKLWGPLSTIKRKREFNFEAPLVDAPPSEWRGEIDQAWFCGSFAMDEIVFFHQPSRTVIFADIIEAFTGEFLCRHWSWWRRSFAHINGITYDNPGPPREWRATFVDRSPARAARDKILGWDFENAIIAHGDWPRANARDFVQRGLSWV